MQVEAFDANELIIFDTVATSVAMCHKQEIEILFVMIVRS